MLKLYFNYLRVQIYTYIYTNKNLLYKQILVWLSKFVNFYFKLNFFFCNKLMFFRLVPFDWANCLQKLLNSRLHGEWFQEKKFSHFYITYLRGKNN